MRRAPMLSRRAPLSRRALLPLALCALLPGCGFHPLYGRATGAPGAVQTQLARINVALMPERSGQLMRDALQARLDPTGSGLAQRYDLSVSFSVTGDALGVQPDSTISRIRLTGSASWTLTAQDAQRSTLATGVARDVDGYNLIDQQFFAFDLENESVTRRIAETLAGQVTAQLASYFDRHPGT